MTTIVPIGVGATRDFIREVAELAGVDPETVLNDRMSRLPWYSASVDSTYLTGKRVFISVTPHTRSLPRALPNKNSVSTLSVSAHSVVNLHGPCAKRQQRLVSKR